MDSVVAPAAAVKTLKAMKIATVSRVMMVLPVICADSLRLRS
ncbi:hypothetical protein MED297_08606 [Reinekea sp. MED297]|uniref:Uncharacterized protein n=1 Tax=Reinekea blandensis MED297 TaxID=314283 RepID=A4BJ22_9GAMM|nr:hypothetical protein MED297_08606 [Reinekea sp. MED297] [Reinekea blandensis MED297]